MVRNRIILVLGVIGLCGGVLSAVCSAYRPKPPPPLLSPAPNPFASGIYANGIVESYQEHGQNTNIYPEVAGVVTAIYVREGQTVHRGELLMTLDDSVQRATTRQLLSQSMSSEAQLDRLRAEPRREDLRVARAQVELADANLQTLRLQLAKRKRSHDIDPRSVSTDVLDDATSAVRVAQANLGLARRQYELVRAGAWSYDVHNSERAFEATREQYHAAQALLDKYTLEAPRDGIVMSVQASVGSYVSPQGVYDSYSRGFGPIAVMADAGVLAVRCYVDEILIPRLPDPAGLQAQMFLRGTTTPIPLEFVRVQPYVSPKIQLSDARTEKVDLRVLPLIFRFAPPTDSTVYPGQLVDVYLSAPPAKSEAPEDALRASR